MPAVLDLLLEHFHEPLAAPPAPPAPKVKVAKPARPKHAHLHGLSDSGLRARLRPDAGSTPSERQAAAALLQARKDSTARVVAKQQARQDAAAPPRSDEKKDEPAQESSIGVLVEAFSATAAPPPGETPAQSQVRGAAQVAAAQKSLAAGWSSAKHPRGVGGKFSYTTGGKRATRAKTTQSRILATGSKGALVKSIQRQLGIPADGIYGPQTQAAVARYQRQHGLLVDGKVGAQTIAALRGNPNARLIKPGPMTTRTASIARHRSQRVSRAKKATKAKAAAQPKPSYAKPPAAHWTGGKGKAPARSGRPAAPLTPRKAGSGLLGGTVV